MQLRFRTAQSTCTLRVAGLLPLIDWQSILWIGGHIVGSGGFRVGQMHPPLAASNVFLRT